MGWSLKLLTVRGIDIKVHATFVLILIWAAYYWSSVTDAGGRGALFGVIAAILLFVCVTLHELGHSFVAMHYGVQVRGITLLPIGGLALMEEIPEKPRQEFWIAVAGPLVNIAIFVVLVAVGAILDATAVVSPGDLIDRMREAEWSGLLTYLTLANISLAIFNFIPAFPMDGGRVLRALLAMRLPYRRATEIAVFVGQAAAFLFGLAGFASGNFFLILIAVFVWMGAGQEGQQVAIRGVLGRARVGDAMIRAPRSLAPSDPLVRAIELTLNTAQADFPVVDADGRVVGLLTADDLLSALRGEPGTLPATIGQAMRTQFPVVRPEEPLTDVQRRFGSDGLRVFPVVAVDGRLAGLLTATDVGEAYRLLSVRPELVSGPPASRTELAPF